MKVVIELRTGPYHNKSVTKEDIQRNIDVLEKVISEPRTALDTILLLDTKSILDMIQQKLPERS